MDRGEADNMNADRREMTDTCLIVSGGPTDRKFAAEFVKNRKYPYVIAVDAGLAVCEELGLVPDLAVGDFDTFGLERMEELKKEEGWATDVHKPEKDETDTELALQRESISAMLACRPMIKRRIWPDSPRVCARPDARK